MNDAPLDLVVLGAGAIGAGLAACATMAGRRAACVSRTGAVEAVHFAVGDRDLHVRLSPPAAARVALLAVKSQDAEAALAEHAALVDRCEHLLVARNGLPWRSGRFARSRHVIVWSCADRIGPTTRWLGRSKLAIERAEAETTAVFAGEHVEVLAPDEREFQRLVFAKLMVNASVNPLSALTGHTPGELLDDPALRERLLAIAAEIAALARALGVADLDPASVLAACEQMRAFRPSMLQDVDRGRPLETAAVVDEPLARCREAAIAAPALGALARDLAAARER
ncbi:MAG TPA: ketopantoate reductase C-terminal domain-containing protein [Nannocystaceae bacterium]|nr:ketopantoate reductase C-terminal domain-containing protein [Nannocystaceae bacterium]